MPSGATTRLHEPHARRRAGFWTLDMAQNIENIEKTPMWAHIGTESWAAPVMMAPQARQVEDS